MTRTDFILQTAGLLRSNWGLDLAPDVCKVCPWEDNGIHTVSTSYGTFTDTQCESCVKINKSWFRKRWAFWISIRFSNIKFLPLPWVIYPMYLAPFLIPDICLLKGRRQWLPDTVSHRRAKNGVMLYSTVLNKWTGLCYQALDWFSSHTQLLFAHKLWSRLVV